MTRWQQGLVVAPGAIVLWACVGIVVDQIPTKATEEKRPLTAVEEAVVDGHLRLARSAPFLTIAAVAAPPVAGILWSLGILRARKLQRLGHERRLLGVRLAWLASCAAVGAAAAVARKATTVEPPVEAWLLLVVVAGWGYAGAVHRGFPIQARRVAMGIRTIDPDWFDIVAGLTLPLGPLGMSVPVWVFWRAGGDMVGAGQVQQADQLLRMA